MNELTGETIMTNNELTDYIANHPVTIKSGKHDSPECGMCILELCSLALGVEWTDDPGVLGLPDIRRLNDAKWCDAETRTREMLRLGVAVWPWRTATDERRVAFARRLSELTIRRVLPPMLRHIGLPREADQCEREGTKASAFDAADAASHAVHVVHAVHTAADYATSYAYYAVDFSTRDVATASSYAATAAADAAIAVSANAARPADAAAASTEMLITAIDCWIEAAAELTGKAA
jgi:hypothetical protein